MNNTLKLKGKFQTKSAQAPGAPALPVGAVVKSEDLEGKIEQLESVEAYWGRQDVPILPLVQVHYHRVVPKSKRLQCLLSEGRKTPNNSIVGAAFEKSAAQGRQCHVITYSVSLEAIRTAISNLKKALSVLDSLGGEIDDKSLQTLTRDGLTGRNKHVGISKTTFANVIRDVHSVARFDVKSRDDLDSYRPLVTIYGSDRSAEQTVSLLQELGINITSASLLDDTTISMTPDQYTVLCEKAPYLVSMSLPDLSQYELPDGEISPDPYELSIPDPGNEPLVGVIDTRFDTGIYFSDWVEYHDEIDSQLGVDPGDYIHGTEVTSLIVDGPHLNPALDDGCGRFRVRHFAVAKQGKNSSFAIISAIRRIVTANPDITVWNLSLGSDSEIPQNTISPEAAVLDELQNRCGVIFIVAGTNKLSTEDVNKPKRIGAPADSINALVVNASSAIREPASYTREGPVLQFFRKPDVSCFGGDRRDKMAVCGPNGVVLNTGTSFAAPWITRKMAYLIHVMNLSRETAKALLIDSASGWDAMSSNSMKLGYGVVPRRIEDILETSNNEIRFILEGQVDAFETYNYRIPVPLVEGKYPYMARATLCYFPKCDKNQGVDYTDTELDLHFGRVGKKGIKSLDNNVQGDVFARTYEGDARRLYRKWDNVKHVSDTEKSRFVPRKSFDLPYWGFKLRKVERFDRPLDEDGNPGSSAGDGMRFGIVVTLRGMDRRNHFEEFKHNCQLQEEPWIVEEIDMNLNVELYNEADIEIDFDDE